MARLEFAGTDEELSRYLAEAAKVFGAWLVPDTKPGRTRLVFGTLLSFNPNEVRWYAVVRREGKELVIEEEIIPFPATRKKLQRLVEFRKTQLVDFLEVKLRGGDAKKFQEVAMRRPFTTLGSSPAGITASVTWLIASAAMSGLFAWLATMLAGLILADIEIREIGRRAFLLKQLGAVSLPSIAELSSADFNFRLGIAALFAAPLAFFTGTLTALAHAIGEIRGALTRLPLGVLLFLAILHGFAFVPVMPVYAALPCSLIVPIMAHTGYGFIWGLKLEHRRPLAPPTRRRSVAITGAILGILLLVVIVPRPRGGEGVVMGMVDFRDRILLGNSAGRRLAQFYYRYTLYAAEPTKPFYETPASDHSVYARTLRAAHYSGQDPRVTARLRELGFAVGTGEASPHEPYDLYVTDSGPVRADQSPEESRAAVAEAARRAFRAGALRELSQVSWWTVFYLGPLALLALAAAVYLPILSILFRKLPPRTALAAVALLFTLSIVGLLAALSSAAGGAQAIREIRGGSPEVAAAHLGDGEVSIRYEAVRRLHDEFPSHRAPEFLEPLVAATRDPDLRVRLWACGALGRLGDARAVPALIERLSDPEFFVRYRAAEGLGGLRARDAVAPLLAMVEENSWYEGLYALEALRRIDPQRY